MLLNIARYIQKRFNDVCKVPCSLKCKSIALRNFILGEGLYRVINNILIHDDIYSDQRYIINSKYWDNLIILDACRYDIFASLIEDFLDGTLYRVVSAGNYTVQWYINTWIKHRYPDVIYFSANPVIRSQRNISHLAAVTFLQQSKVLEYGHKFKKVIDLWDRCWDSSLYTVPPWNVNAYVKMWLRVNRIKKSIGLGSSKVRLVIHYVQPHVPYLTMPEPLKKSIYELLMHSNISYSDALLCVLCNIFSDEQKMKNYLRKLYIDNVRFVLKYVADLVTYLDGVTIITSDHGEFLGEHGLYFHMISYPFPELRYIPLFIVR